MERGNVRQSSQERSGSSGTSTPPDVLTTATGLERTMDDLTVLLRAESDGVYARSTRDLAALCDRKAQLFAAYVSALNILHDCADPDGNGSALRDDSRRGGGHAITLPESLKASLRRKYDILSDAMKGNMQALAVATEASRRVVEMIVEAVQQQRQTGAGYGVTKHGILTGLEGTAQAVTLDTRL